MKYLVAVVASGAVLLFWAVICALVGLRHGGGNLGMAIMWMIVIAVWTVVINYFPDKKALRSPTDTHAAAENLSSDDKAKSGTPDQAVEATEEQAYAQAWAECHERQSARSTGLWAKAYTLSGGDEVRTVSRYIALRVDQLQSEARRARATTTVVNPVQITAPPEDGSRTIRGYRFAPSSSPKGEAFCFVCRRVDVRDKLLNDPDHDLFGHPKCLDVWEQTANTVAE